MDNSNLQWQLKKAYKALNVTASGKTAALGLEPGRLRATKAYTNAALDILQDVRRKWFNNEPTRLQVQDLQLPIDGLQKVIAGVSANHWAAASVLYLVVKILESATEPELIDARTLVQWAWDQIAEPRHVKTRPERHHNTAVKQ